jgi:hypothetical protein
MGRPAKISILLALCVAWAFSIVVAYETGGRIGHTIGSADTASWETISHGIAAYRMLAQLPEGASGELRESLERAIDYALITYLTLSAREPSRFDLYPLHIAPCGRLPDLAAHRVHTPSPSDDAYRLKLIEQAVRQLSTLSSVAAKSEKCGAQPAA